MSHLFSPALINFVAILGVFVTEMGIDIYLPAVNCMSGNLKTTREILNMALSANLMAFALSAPIYGALSDSFGRRRVLLWGLLIFTMGSLLCGMAKTGYEFVFFRFVQGLGAGVSYGLGVAIQKDMFDGAAFAKARASLSLVLGFAPAAAPIVGGYMAFYMSWHKIFFVITALGVVTLFLAYTCVQETHKPQHWVPFGIRDMGRQYGKILRHKTFMTYAGLAGIFGTVYWGFISGITFLFLQQLKVTEINYPYYQIPLLGSFVLGTIINRMLAATYGGDRALEGAMRLSFLFSLIYCAVTMIYPDHPVLLVIFMAPICGCMGVIFPNLGLRSMEVYTHARGYAAAAYGSIELFSPALGVQVMSFVYTGEAISITSCIVVLHIIAMYVWNAYKKSEHRYQLAASEDS